MTVAVLGIDLAKRVFQLHGIDAHGRVLVSRQVSRGKLVETVVQLAPEMVAMEACCGAHRDAEAICEAAALINHTRGLLLEYGIALPQGPARFRQEVLIALDDGRPA
jgi:transposase